MSYNRYNTRTRYNTPGKFVSAGELSGQAKTYNIDMQQQHPQQHQQQQQYQTACDPPLPPSYMSTDPPPTKEEVVDEMQQDYDMNNQSMDESGNGENAKERPHWMKSKLQGVKKITNRERRRRQNESLRRLLSPKNALMVLNEIMPGENLLQNFKVEQVPHAGQYFKANANNFCADLSFEGNNYKGYGENKMSARNAAAEQAVRDLLLRRMTTALAAAHADGGGSQNGEQLEEDLPMIQLASFALHKLFSEWEVQGHKVPTLKPTSNSMSESVGEAVAPAPRAAKAAAPKPPKPLPAEASAMHPCMLLAQMRPGLAYREAAAQGDKPQNMLFTMEVDVDGRTFSGRAGNKREARKAAARAACAELFGVTFNDQPQ